MEGFQERFAVLEAPAVVPRFIPLESQANSGNLRKFIPVEELVANNLEVSKKQAALSVKYGGPGAIFGMPEHVEPFNAMLKKVAAENNCYFIDLYSAMKGNADIPKWFVRDGIHFTPAGNQQVAGLILKALAEKGSPLK